MTINRKNDGTPDLPVSTEAKPVEVWEGMKDDAVRNQGAKTIREQHIKKIVEEQNQ